MMFLTITLLLFSGVVKLYIVYVIRLHDKSYDDYKVHKNNHV